MSVEKILFGAIIAVGLAGALVIDTEPKPPAVLEATADQGPTRLPIAASEIQTTEDLQRRTSSTDCPDDPVSVWNADRVQALARCLSAATPIEYADGNTLTAVRSEGGTLVFAIRNPGSLAGYVADAEAGAIALCNHDMPRSIIARGVAIRMEMVGTDGSSINPVTVDRCA